jgi:hypothetical protein
MRDGIAFEVDFSELASTIGAFEGIADAASNERYVGAALDDAHAIVSKEFDSEVTAAAMASGRMNHMFEWGTQGINSGRTTRRINPLSAEARLWRDTLKGMGATRTLGFDFEPSKVPVPVTTTNATGISQKFLTKLQQNKYVFWNKAAVMESGSQVTITPKPGKKLFIPLVGRTSVEGLRPVDIARGFIMTPHTVTSQPGKKTAGTFSAYWMDFWNNRGEKMMRERFSAIVQKDVDTTVAATSRGGRTAGPPSSAEFRAQVKSAQARAAQTMKTRRTK